jgi:outer membrane protein OmpA-like peptidoglycan-associated protein
VPDARSIVFLVSSACAAHAAVDLGSTGAETLPTASVHAADVRPPPPSAHDEGGLLEIGRSGVLVVPTPPFHPGNASLMPEADAILRRVAALLFAREELSIRIEAHTDGLGMASFNRELSRQRALAVGRWLVDNGVDCRRITAFGLGEDQPIAPNTTAEGRAQNRRIVFTVHPGGGATQLCVP